MHKFTLKSKDKMLKLSFSIYHYSQIQIESLLILQTYDLHDFH